MSESIPGADEATPAPLPTPAPAPTAFPLGLDEWCSHHSKTARQPELLGAFYATEMRAGRVHAMAEEFAVRFAAFANAPA